MRKKKSGPARVMLSIIALLLAAGIVCSAVIVYLATQDNIEDKYTLTQRDEGIAMEILKGGALGKEFELSQDMINTFANDKLCRNPEVSSTCLEKIMVYFNEDAPVEIYAHVYYKGNPLAVRCKAIYDIDESTSEVSAKIYDAYVGELKLPDNILDLLLQKVFENNEHIHCINSAGHNISFHAEYTFDIRNTAGITVSLLSAESKDGAVVCRTNNITGEALKAAVEYITSKEGSEAVKKLFGKITDKLGKIKDKLAS